MGVAIADYVSTLTGGFWRSTAWAPITDESTIAIVAASITVGLNEQIFSQSFVAEMTYQPQIELRDLTDLRVRVVPGTSEVVRVTRSLRHERLVIEIGLQQRIESDSEIGRLMRLADEIIEWVIRTSVFENARVISAEKAPQYSTEHVTMRAFTELISITLMAEMD